MSATYGDELAPLAALRSTAKLGAIGCHARGEYDHERRWLDALVLIDQAQKIHAQLLADERERIAREIEAERPEMGSHVNVSPYRQGKDDGLTLARDIARGQA